MKRHLQLAAGGEAACGSFGRGNHRTWRPGRVPRLLQKRRMGRASGKAVSRGVGRVWLGRSALSRTAGQAMDRFVKQFLRHLDIMPLGCGLGLCPRTGRQTAHRWRGWPACWHCLPEKFQGLLDARRLVNRCHALNTPLALRVLPSCFSFPPSQGQPLRIEQHMLALSVAVFFQ